VDFPGVGTLLKFFITSETTSDVGHSELLVLIDFEDQLNRTASDLKIGGIELIGIVLVVMNPEVALPFRSGCIFRRTKKMLDIKPAVAFSSWKAADSYGRIGLIIDATMSVLSGPPTPAVSDGDIRTLGHLLRWAHSALAEGT